MSVTSSVLMPQMYYGGSRENPVLTVCPVKPPGFPEGGDRRNFPYKARLSWNGNAPVPCGGQVSWWNSRGRCFRQRFRG